MRLAVPANTPISLRRRPKGSTSTLSDTIWRLHQHLHRRPVIRTSPQRKDAMRLTLSPAVLEIQRLVGGHSFRIQQAASIPVLAVERWCLTTEVPIRREAVQHCCSTLLAHTK